MDRVARSARPGCVVLAVALTLGLLGAPGAVAAGGQMQWHGGPVVHSSRPYFEPTDALNTPTYLSALAGHEGDAVSTDVVGLGRRNE
jgi:hypothetical protein